MSRSKRQVPRPFLKWAGGKGQLLEQLKRHMPSSSFDCYYEPFVGGGALFFDLKPEKAVLFDSNRELIHTYCAVREWPEDVISELRRHRYEEDYYYEVRALDPGSLDLPSSAARTIFLNRTCFNGLYRVNKAGKFNVPFGRYKNPVICDADNLRACSVLLQHATIASYDFAEVEWYAQQGDFVYFDPPYYPLSVTSSFTAYTQDGFRWEDQQRLAKVAKGLADKGVHVMISSSDTPAIRKLYQPIASKIVEVQATRRISSKGNGRGEIGELIIVL